jgi:diguanylate cyclase (GGDEF)-like protein/PAS domain S-box-containing protein
MTNPVPLDRQAKIRALFDDYIELYASRNDRLTTLFSDNFSGFTGGGDFLVHDRSQWAKVTRQDFAQVPERIGIDLLDIAMQDLAPDVVMVTAFFHIQLPGPELVLANEVARLVLVFRLEGLDWKIVHSGISIPYHLVQQGEVYPLKGLQAQNKVLEGQVQARTQALHESESLYRLLTEDTLDVVWKTDQNLCVTYISPADERLRGFKADEVVGHSVFEMFTPEGTAMIKKQLRSNPRPEISKTQEGYWQFIVQHRCKDGRLLWGEILSKPVRNAQGAITGHHGITRECSERVRLEEEVRQLAFYDALTKLPNRRLLDDRLTKAMASGKRSGRYGALMVLDLDNFKPLNDAHGHQAGDLLLAEVARRLTDCVRAVDTVARFGGDEFVVILGELSTDEAVSANEAREVAEKIRLSLAMPYQLTLVQAGQVVADVVHHCSASMGVVLFCNHDASQAEVLRWADAAMYEAKDAGRNTVCFYQG